MSAAASTISTGADAEPPHLGEATATIAMLDDLLVRLQHEGFSFDLRQRTAALRIVIAWRADPELGNIIDLLSPIFARTSDQQERFRTIAAIAWPRSWRGRSDRLVQLREARDRTVKVKPGLATRITQRTGQFRLLGIAALLILAFLVYWLWPANEIAPPPPEATGVTTPAPVPDPGKTGEVRRPVTFSEYTVESTDERQPIFSLALLAAAACLYHLAVRFARDSSAGLAFRGEGRSRG